MNTVRGALCWTWGKRAGSCVREVTVCAEGWMGGWVEAAQIQEDTVRSTCKGAPCRKDTQGAHTDRGACGVHRALCICRNM